MKLEHSKEDEWMDGWIEFGVCLALATKCGIARDNEEIQKESS